MSEESQPQICVDPRIAFRAESSVRNSVVVSYSDQPEVDCPNLESINNFTEDGSGMTFDDLSNWFVDFEGGDFHLSGSYPQEIDTPAVWLSGDPAVDIDEDPRPMADGSPDVAGADIP